MEKILLFNKFFRLPIRASVAKIWPDKVVLYGAQMPNFCILYFSEPHAAHFRPAF